jgi:hypothetical protein
MRGPEFLGDHGSFLAAFTSLCDWADEIIICTSRIDVGEGWRALTNNIVKVRHCMVSDNSPSLAALGPLQAKGALRLVGGHGSQYRPNVYLFRRDSESRALVGSVRLMRDGVESGVESVTRVDGKQDDPFACALSDFVETCLARSRLPRPGELSPDGPSPAVYDDLDEKKLSPKHVEPLRDAGVGRLLPVRDAEGVSSAHQHLWSLIVSNGTRLRVEVGRRRRDSLWNSYLGFWATRLKSAERYWYVFGARDPRGQGPPDITLIVTIPVDRYDPNASGAFAIEPERQRLVLVHRGGFGGRRHDGKRLFWRTTRLRGAEMLEEEDKTTRVALVAELSSRETLEQFAAYIREVDRLRALGRRPADDGTTIEARVGRECELFIEVADADDRASLVWEELLGLGVLSKDESVRLAAHGLRESGRADFRRLDSSGSLYEAVLDSIERGVRLGLLDRPRRGFIRATLESAQDYPDWLWQSCLLASLDREFVSRDEAVRGAAGWAVENLALRHRNLRAGGRVDVGLRRALARSIRQGKVEKKGRDLVRLADAP